VAQSFMDYLLPSAQEVPPVEIVEHVTPSPHTVFGQKGSGEAGYLGAPAAIASAVNDALAPLGLAVNGLPIKMTQLADMIAARRRPTVSSSHGYYTLGRHRPRMRTIQ
jgi:CO/xanthine dehydrogenase Mo-binding subunit